MLCALIMAGGKGTRFWPLSTENNPKQFLNLIGEKSMIQITVNRIKKIIPIENIFVVTDQKYFQLVTEHLVDLPTENIIIEPVGMNTAPCIALSAMLINKRFPNATLAVLPSDHLVQQENLFRKTLQAAELYVEMNPESIVTIGIEVSRPETNYGYIKYVDEIDSIYNLSIRKVDKFVEKPSLETAQKYMEQGGYLWNSGMFIWKVSNIINLTKKHLLSTYELLSDIINSSPDTYKQKLFQLYPKVKNTSVDYGIMEHAKEICVIPSLFGWDDIGSWLSLKRYHKTDEHNNVIKGDITALDSRDNIIVSSSKPMVVCGVENLILVETDEVIMVIKTDNINKITELRKILIP